MSRQRLLFLAQVLPYPPDGGVKIRSYHVLRLLSSRFDVVALCFYREKGGRLEARPLEALRRLQEYGQVEAFPVPQDQSMVRWAWDHCRSLVRRRVYTRFVYESLPVRQRLLALIRDTAFDLVHVDSLDLALYLPLLRHLPTICVHHDVQSDLLRRRAEVETRPLAARYVGYQAELMAEEERIWVPQVDLNITVSARDRDVLRSGVSDGRFAVVPNGVDTDYFRPGGNGETVVFVGGTTWFPNADALRYFAEEIFPHLSPATAGSELEIQWVGRATEEERDRYGRRGIRMTGYVDDVRPFIRDAACYIVPLRVGGGTRIKILDAWAMGKAVVSTSVGCEGLHARDGENIMVRDRPTEFAAAVKDVLSDGELRERLGRAGRKTVEERYSWKVIGQDMCDLYEGLIS